MTVPLIHPRFAAMHGRFFPSRATVESASETETQDAYGQPIDEWTPFVGMESIPAVKAPMSASEIAAAGYTATDQVWQVLLQGAYPAITTRHRVTIDGAAYDIDAAETDQTGSLTRLRVRQVTI